LDVRSLRVLVMMLVGLALAACAAPPPPSPSSAPPSPTTVTRTTTTRIAPTLTPPAGAPAALAGTIMIDGSSTVFPITEAAGVAFRSYVPQVEIRLGVSGTGGGLKKFCAGEVDIADASRPISPSEAATCAQAGISYIELPIAFDGISVVLQL
jgi:phosphate transport system substrate-binding protein